MRFTAKSVEHIKPGATRREIPDGGCAGLYLQVQPSGKKSWAVRYRYQGHPTKLTLIGVTSLADARVAATRAREQVAKGMDPAKAKADAKIRTDAAKADTVTAICENYLKREGGKLRTLDQRVSILKRLVYPMLGSRPIGEIRRSEIVHLLDRVEDNSGPRAADVTLGVLRRIFHWHEKRSDEFRSPIIRGMARQNAKDHRRERILDDDELRRIWVATADGSPFASLVRLALLTSARRNEIAGLRWDEIDGDVWTLPPSRSKTKVEVVRPLSAAALAVLEGMPRIDGCDFIFTSNAISPINNFSDSKRKLDLVSGTSGWRLHDLRRSSRSLLSRAGVNSDVAEKCLGHARGDIVERYDRHSYTREMRDAFEALSALVARIVNPPPEVVADMAAERSKRRR
jgi:integrase